MKLVATLAAVLLALPALARAVPTDPAFRRHPAPPTGFHPPARLRGDDPRTRQYADALFWSLSHVHLDAAGHFLLAEIGCGAGCILLAAIDARTGSVRWLPSSISAWPIEMHQPVRARPDSRLVVISGQLV